MTLRALAVATLALAVPTFAAAQAPPEPPHFKKPAPHVGPPPPHPHGLPPRPGALPLHPVGPLPGAFRGPPGPGAQFSYHGRMFNPIHVSPFAYPPGWAYRRWAVGAVLPPIFLAPDYYYSDWATLGLEAPQSGFQWVRYGPDLLLVNVGTGEVAEVVYGAFY